MDTTPDRQHDDADELLRAALLDAAQSAAVSLKVGGLPVSRTVTVVFHGRRDLGTIQTYVAPGARARPGRRAGVRRPHAARRPAAARHRLRAARRLAHLRASRRPRAGARGLLRPLGRARAEARAAHRAPGGVGRALPRAERR